MEIAQLFLQRYDVLYDFWLGGIWDMVPYDLMRQRPHPQVNSIAWNMWHLTRAEDAGLNRFVVDRPQVLDKGGWMQKMDLPWRHHGGEMTFAEVDDLNRRIDLPALREYSQAVQARTHEIIAQIHLVNLDDTLQEAHVRAVIIDEGLAHSQPEGFIKTYSGWTKGKCLMNLGLTHPYQHLGEISVIASLLGVVFD
ncbi:MAG TPA: DinB family protein [Anaerolineaceae bacterium]|nr:DinB family protein [Anaerolineaceae bacterium]